MQQPAFELLQPRTEGEAEGSPGDLPDVTLAQRLASNELFDSYKGRLTADGVDVVVKLPRVDDALARQLLRHEADMLERCRHAGVARLVRFVETAEACYLATAAEPGESLADRLAAQAAGWDEAELWPLLAALLDTLAAIHDRGVLHGDLKPANIVLRPDGSPVLVDFGCARRWEEEPECGETSRLTPGYAAPELYVTEGRVGPWSDLYSLAAVAYRALSGEAPPDAAQRLERDCLVSLAERAPAGCSAAFLAALDSALALEPAARPQAAAAWRDRLASERLIESPAGEEDADYPPTIEVRRRPEPSVRPSPAAGPEPEQPRDAGERRRWVARAIGGLVVLLALAAYPAWEGYERFVKTEWTVSADGGGDTRGIGSALAQARSGAVIAVQPGTYRESLVLDRPVTLVGVADEDGNLPVIEPLGGSCLVVTAAGGTIRGLHFRGPAAAEGAAAGAEAPACVHLRASGFRIEQSRFEQPAAAAILVEAGAEGTIADSFFQGAGKAALVVRQGAAPEVLGNAIEGSGQAGILIEDGAAGRYENNRISAGAAAGIEVRDGGDPLVIRNRIEGNREAGLYVYRGGRGTYRDNRIAENGFSGVIVASGAAPQLGGNEIADNGQHGVLLLDAGAGTLSDNNIRDNAGHGIARGMSARVELDGNRLSGNREPQLQRGAIEVQ